MVDAEGFEPLPAVLDPTRSESIPCLNRGEFRSFRRTTFPIRNDRTLLTSVNPVSTGSCRDARHEDGRFAYSSAARKLRPERGLAAPFAGTSTRAVSARAVVRACTPLPLRETRETHAHREVAMEPGSTGQPHPAGISQATSAGSAADIAFARESLVPVADLGAVLCVRAGLPFHRTHDESETAPGAARGLQTGRS